MLQVVITNGRDRLEAQAPERPIERVRGLIGSSPGRSLLLRTRSVHTFGMRRSIDVVLLDAELRVVGIVRLQPRRLLLPRRGVRHVLETDRAPFSVGDRLGIVADPAPATTPAPSGPTSRGAPTGA